MSVPLRRATGIDPIGAEHDGGLFGEFKIGVSDSPDLKLMVGYSFR